jgi:hypothetical protein
MGEKGSEDCTRWEKRSEKEGEGGGQPDDDDLANITYGRQRSKWLPRSLELLFGKQKVTSIDEQVRRAHRRQAFTEEARLMELLVDEELDEERIPDDGELEGSGDDFDGWRKSAIFRQWLNNPLDKTLIKAWFEGLSFKKKDWG